MLLFAFRIYFRGWKRPNKLPFSCFEHHSIVLHNILRNVCTIYTLKTEPPFSFITMLRRLEGRFSDSGFMRAEWQFPFATRPTMIHRPLLRLVAARGLSQHDLEDQKVFFDNATGPVLTSPSNPADQVPDRA